MGFLDLFKPKWRHSNADVRAEAVRQLTPEDAAILAQIVKRDEDARVRRLALKKIEDPDVLLEIARSDEDEALRRAAQEKADDLLLSAVLAAQDAVAAKEPLSRLGQKALLEAARRAQSGAVRQLAAEQLGDDRALAELVRTSDDAQLRSACLERIGSEAALRDVAVNPPVKEIGLKALARLSDLELVRDVAQRSKAKAVRAAAQQRLGVAPERRAQPTAEKAREKQRRNQLLSLCQRAESAARGSDLVRAEADLRAARDAWEALGSEPGDEPLRQRFEKAAAQLRERQAAQRRKEEEAQQRAEAARRERERCERRAALCERVERLDGDTLPAQLLEARAAWGELGAPEGEAERELGQRFARAVKEALRRHEQADSRKAARERLAQVVAEVEELAGAPGALRRLRGLELRWRELEGALLDSDELRGRYERAAAEVRRRAEEVQQRKRAEAEAAREQLLALCTTLEGLIENGDRKRAEAALKEVPAALKQAAALPPAQREEVAGRLREARDRLVIRLKDLREEEDWKRWANVPRAEQLCQAVEALREETDSQKVQRALGQARAAWKQVGPLPKEKSEVLWQRFKGVLDELSGRVKEHQVVFAEERAENLKKKVALCEQAEALVDSTDWKGTSERLKALQAEWKQIGPVPKAEADAVWKRFRAACDRFFERRKLHDAEGDKERGENARRLEALCQRAEALAESTDWKEAADQLKRLQVDWKEVGPAPKAESEALWKRFRAACDRFFERRKLHFAEVEAERAENLQRKKALCLDVEQLFDSEGMGEQEAQEAVRRYMAQWKQIGPVPKAEADALWERFRTACDRLLLRQWLPPDLEAPRFENRPLSDLAQRLAASAAKPEPGGGENGGAP